MSISARGDGGAPLGATTHRGGSCGHARRPRGKKVWASVLVNGPTQILGELANLLRIERKGMVRGIPE